MSVSNSIILPRSVWETMTNNIDGPSPYRDWITTRVYHFPGTDWSDLDFNNDGKIEKEVDAGVQSFPTFSWGNGANNSQLSSVNLVLAG